MSSLLIKKNIEPDNLHGFSEIEEKKIKFIADIDNDEKIKWKKKETEIRKKRY